MLRRGTSSAQPSTGLANRPPVLHPCTRPSRKHLCPPLNVLAPPERPQAPAREKPISSQVPAAPPADQPPRPPLPLQSGASKQFWSMVNGTTGFANQLMSHFRIWPSISPLLAIRQAEEVLQEAASMEKEKQQTSLPVDVTKFLAPVGVWELKHIRKLSSLTALTYKMWLVTPSGLRRRHNLDLIATSLSCELSTYEHNKTAEEIGLEGDGMAVSFGQANNSYQAVKNADKTGATLVTVSKDIAVTAPPAQSKRWNPVDEVAAKLTEAAAMASAAAAYPFTTAAGSIYAGLASLPIGPNLTSGSRSNGNTNNTVGSGNGVGTSTTKTSSAVSPTAKAAVAATMAAVAEVVATETTGLPSTSTSSSPATAPAPATPASDPASCPSEWFVCDDPHTNTRYFVIQGSDTLDHWKLNLTFDPVTFEERSLGVKVHRGVYEAALALYDRFLPMVYEHLESSPYSKIAFTGHSIGGSLATLLMLMYKHRGVLPTHSIATVYTFGAPAVFCETGSPPPVAVPTAASSFVSDEACRTCGSPSCSGCSLDTHSGLLSRLGVPEHIIRNVIMHRDIVPRAFACDYSLVADILRGWGSSFKEHHSLSWMGRKHLYYFLGRMIVLQPDIWHNFVNNDPYHPMLPPGPEIYTLSAATASSSDSASAQRSTAIQEGKPLGVEAESVVHAVRELMDNPHPLDILADPGAYLEKGSISRYHNPEHYTRALGRIIYLKRMKEERVPSVANVFNMASYLSRKGDVTGKQWDSSDADRAPMLYNGLYRAVEPHHY